MSSAPSGWPKQFVDILGSKMAYVEFGTGDPIVFLHGNPTSSYLWRNIAPELSDLGRCVVPDLIGMGDSAKLSESGPAWLAGSPVPKLFINAEPGAILTGRMRELCRTWPNQQEVTVGGVHFLQEDPPQQISSAIRNWLIQSAGSHH